MNSTKKFITSLFILILVSTIISPLFVNAENNIKPNTWSYVDGLGRTESTFGEIPKAKDDHPRFVGIFYHTWHTEFSVGRTPVNITQVVTENPEAAKNVKENVFWTQNFERYYTPGYFWNEPLFGYYSTLDEYVLRKHAELLADAGVDFIYIDGTNGRFLWEKGVDAILKVFAEAKADGVDVPQIVFWLSLSEIENRIAQLRKLYTRWYSKPEYDDMWFKWEGKPLVLCYKDVLEKTYKNSVEINNMFTFRPINPSYFNQGNSSEKYWGWLSVYPQCKYGKTADGRPEQMAVGVAQNANSDRYLLTYMAAGEKVMGRSFAAPDKDTEKNYSYSYTYGNVKYTVDQRNDFATLAGRNFQQQWDYAIECDPDVILVTGWNEWTAHRESGFCDAFTDEYSRDTEPTKGLLKDYYYYQMVANIRRYKGVDKNNYYIGNNKSIDIFSEDLSQWDSVISYNHYTNSTRDRDCAGYKTHHYENFTMRNDIVLTKVSYDDNNFYFYVSTKDTLSPETDQGWMRLFIDTDYSGNSSNWEGFEYVINRTNPENNKCTLERSKGMAADGSWLWEKAGEIKYSVQGNVLQLEVPQKLLGFKNGKFDFSFKWSDNMQTDGDIMDFYSNGDVAPGGRFCFKFTNIIPSDSINPIIIVSLVCMFCSAVFVFFKTYRKAKLGLCQANLQSSLPV